MTEKQIERIKKRIRSYRAKLSAEKRKFGWYDDSRGLRYLIPELYIQIQDFKGSLRYYKWFNKEFSDDIGFPEFNLYWSLTCYENKDLTEALRKLYKTSFTNTYLVDLICKRNPTNINKSELISFESLEYAKQILSDCEKLITPAFKEWLKSTTRKTDFKKNMNRFISLQKLIKDESPGHLRSSLLNESREFEDKLTVE
jgi:hypothetical protein